MIASPAKAAEPIVMLFRILTLVGPRNYALDGILIPTCERAILRVKRGRPRTCLAVSIPKTTQQGKNCCVADAD